MHHRRAKTINNHACVTKTARDAAKIPDRSYLSEVLRRINLLRAMNVVSRPDGMQEIEFTFFNPQLCIKKRYDYSKIRISRPSFVYTRPRRRIYIFNP